MCMGHSYHRRRMNNCMTSSPTRCQSHSTPAVLWMVPRGANLSVYLCIYSFAFIYFIYNFFFWLSLPSLLCPFSICHKYIHTHTHTQVCPNQNNCLAYYYSYIFFIMYNFYFVFIFCVFHLLNMLWYMLVNHSHHLILCIEYHYLCLCFCTIPSH